jgi:hypothetical protein
VSWEPYLLVEADTLSSGCCVETLYFRAQRSNVVLSSCNLAALMKYVLPPGAEASVKKISRASLRMSNSSRLALAAAIISEHAMYELSVGKLARSVGRRLRGNPKELVT